MSNSAVETCRALCDEFTLDEVRIIASEYDIYHEGLSKKEICNRLIDAETGLSRAEMAMETLLRVREGKLSTRDKIALSGVSKRLHSVPLTPKSLVLTREQSMKLYKLPVDERAKMLKYVHTLDLSDDRTWQKKREETERTMRGWWDNFIPEYNVTDVSMLGGVHTLNLTGNTNRLDVSALGNVHTLDLSGTNVEDVSMLGNVHTLSLSGALYVEDLSALGNVHTLYLSYLTELTDVSMFGGVHTLDLTGTPVEDVSALGNVHTLYLSGTPVKDVSALGNVHTLDLSGTPVEDVSALGNVHTLDLSGTPVEDVSALGNVHTLNLYGTRVSDVSMLGRVHIIDLRNTPYENMSFDNVINLTL